MILIDLQKPVLHCKTSLNKMYFSAVVALPVVVVAATVTLMARHIITQPPERTTFLVCPSLLLFALLLSRCLIYKTERIS